MMTEKCCLSAGEKKKDEEDIRRQRNDSGEEPTDKEKNGVKQKLNEMEGMTEIRSGPTEEETSGNGGREMTSVRERRGMGGRTEGTGEKEEGKKMRRDGKVKKGKNKDRKA